MRIRLYTEEADRFYTAVFNPQHPDANHNMGVLAVDIGKVQEALPFFKTALEVNPNIAQNWLSYIDALIKLDKTDDAQAVFDKSRNKGLEGDDFDEIEKRLIALSIETKENTKDQGQTNILDTLKLNQAIKLAKKKIKEGSLGEAKRIYLDILKKFPKNKKAIEELKWLVGQASSNSKKTHDPPQDQLQQLHKSLW